MKLWQIIVAPFAVTLMAMATVFIVLGTTFAVLYLARLSGIDEWMYQLWWSASQ